MLAATLLLFVAAGAAIGATGIGGVLVVPALTMLAGQDVLGAVAASSFAFAATGVAAVWRSAAATTATTKPTRGLRWLHAAALLGALAGAAVAPAFPPAVLGAGVAALALVSGLHALVDRAPPPQSGELPPPLALAALGLAVGVGSALSGTGGPVLLLPLLMLLRAPLMPAIAAAQGIQLPVALAASSVHAMAGRLDLRLGMALAAALLAGWWCGHHLTRAAPLTLLRRIVAVFLVLTGIWTGWGLLR
jgi:uncharacterized membrane protein YfcA